MLAVEADTLRTAGAALTIPSVCLAAGVVAFAAAVHHGNRAEVSALLRVAIVAAVMAVAGAAVEVAGVARLFGEGWVDALSDRVPAALMRLLGAALMAAGLFEAPALRRAGPDDGEVRWSLAGPGVFAIAGGLLGVTSFAFDGHTVSRGPRVVHAASDVVHVAAASIWAGGVVALMVLTWVRREAPSRPTAHLAHAFGRVATVALGAVVVMGLVMTWFVLDAPADLWASNWGRRLLLKVTLVAAATAFGAHHHFRPANDVRRLRRALTLEAVLLGGALVVTAYLVRASPN